MEKISLCWKVMRSDLPKVMREGQRKQRIYLTPHCWMIFDLVWISYVFTSKYLWIHQLIEFLYIASDKSNDILIVRYIFAKMAPKSKIQMTYSHAQPFFLYLLSFDFVWLWSWPISRPVEQYRPMWCMCIKTH